MLKCTTTSGCIGSMTNQTASPSTTYKKFEMDGSLGTPHPANGLKGLNGKEVIGQDLLETFLEFASFSPVSSPTIWGTNLWDLSQARTQALESRHGPLRKPSPPVESRTTWTRNTPGTATAIFTTGWWLLCRGSLSRGQYGIRYTKPYSRHQYSIIIREGDICILRSRLCSCEWYRSMNSPR